MDKKEMIEGLEAIRDTFGIETAYEKFVMQKAINALTPEKDAVSNLLCSDGLCGVPPKLEINLWLKEQSYQTDTDDTGEYTLYFGCDMPTILEDYFEWRKERKTT